jgi:uncharacterized protein
VDTSVAKIPARPVPRPTAVTAPFWDACKEGRLLYQRCPGCGTAIFPPQSFCPNDLSTDLDWRESVGLGTIYSYTTIWRPQTPAFEVPYSVAIIELDEGYTMLCNVDVEPERMRIGLPLSVTFRPLSEEITAPCFVERETVS